MSHRRNPFSRDSQRRDCVAPEPPRHLDERARQIWSLIPIEQPIFSEMLADTLAARARLVECLREVCRRERTRGLNGHWTYDLPRHSALLRIYKREKAALELLQFEAVGSAHA